MMMLCLGLTKMGSGSVSHPAGGVERQRRIAFTAASTPASGGRRRVAGAPSLRIIVKSEEPVRRPRHANSRAQRLAFIFAPEQTASLQFRHHAFDEIVEPAGQVGKHHGGAAGPFGEEPFLHFVGDGLGRADHGEAGIAAEALGELAHGQVLLTVLIDRPLATALAGIAFGNIGQGTVGVELGGVVAERDRKRGNGVEVMHYDRPLAAEM